MSDEPLRVAGPRILQCRGASYEGDVFSALRRSRFVVRSFEFALADGAIDCTRTHTDRSYAERFWTLHDQRYLDPSQLLLFDVKSTIGDKAGDQVYVGNLVQRRHVAFHVGISAAEPTFVDLIPNYEQVEDALSEMGTQYTADAAGQQEVSINVTRVCALPPGAYGGIDQCSSPYRLPLTMLPEAIARIRRHILDPSMPYVNPWTQVEFADWRPLTTSMLKFMRPSDDVAQATAFEAVMEIYRAVKHNERTNKDLEMDFMGSQPDLADFKLIHQGRQYFVQHKLDVVLRAMSSQLNRVSIARSYNGLLTRHYFSLFSRFDFLWFQFLFSKGNGEVQHKFYFVPEVEMPDELFVTEAKEVDFGSYSNLQRFRINLDPDGDWLQAVRRIIVEYPQPRQLEERPLRRSQLDQFCPPPTSTVLESKEPEKQTAAHHQGRRLFNQAGIRGHRSFFYGLTLECAQRRRGLLIVLASKHTWGDYGYCRQYRWSVSEQKAFAERAQVPRACHHLPADAEVVPLSFHIQHAESSFTGPNVRASTFRRLDSSTEFNLTIWDVAGPDAGTIPLRLAVIPSQDLRPSDAQCETFNRNLQLDKSRGGRDENNPNLSALLCSGLLATEYGVGEGGPLAYESENVWTSEIWELLDRFSSLEAFEHPFGYVRQPAQYRYTLKQVHQRLHDQYRQDQDQPKATTDSGRGPSIDR
ncbi:hypothetical protein LTR37_014080 [Vermiconidia calcicola]|uniref:Uncharacterized protein n=1 Tax=Vermiconidia calcicola TaxID=1690605 RepID=A0ACC3MW00_9PEZI|nr:hypothetical protein LTR37_014080 [Vermiconidia calcicola]